MEVTEIPFLNQEFDCMHLLNLLQDMDSFDGGDDGAGGWNPPLSKRRRAEKGGFVQREEGGCDSFEADKDSVRKSSSGSPFRELLASFMLMEEGATARELNFQGDMSMVDANNQRKRAQPMTDYYQNQSNFYYTDQLSETSQSPPPPLSYCELEDPVMLLVEEKQRKQSRGSAI
ncbi:hypothetical protein SAY86_001916 [Trapa natans]|uniref:Uncharacterized protein n=1 Tax=Trapa natans TaxID=22666 RepID=A0AAN7LSZ9_TRANT|nr:hypothetical protein SAY86_001916 [Trapa natans]